MVTDGIISSDPVDRTVGRADKNSWHASNPVYCTNFLRSLHERCSPPLVASRAAFLRHPSPRFLVFRNFQTSHPEFSNIFTLRLPTISPTLEILASDRSERAASVNILFSIAESFPPILERCTTRKNDNFLSSSVFIRNVTERQITQRAMYIYIVGDTYIYIYTGQAFT